MKNNDKKTLNEDEKLFEIMVSALIQKYGLFLNSTQCAKVIRASDSTRGLDESRKKSVDVPGHIGEGKNILYPVQEVVKYQIEKSKKETVRTIY